MPEPLHPIPVEQAAHKPAVFFDLAPHIPMDERLINRRPEGSEQNMQLGFVKFCSCQSPAVCLRIIHPSGISHHFHPIMLKVGIGRALCTAEQQHKIVVLGIEIAEPPQHVVPFHVPGAEQSFIRHARNITACSFSGNCIHIIHRILNHRAEQILLAAVPLIQRPSGNLCPLADRFERSFFKPMLEKFLFGALQDARIDRMVCPCYMPPCLIIKLSMIQLSM